MVCACNRTKLHAKHIVANILKMKYKMFSKVRLPSVNEHDVMGEMTLEHDNLQLGASSKGLEL